MSLVEQVSEDLKSAMKAKDEVRLRSVRNIRAEILKKEKEGKGAVTDDDVLAILNRLVNQRNESISMFENAGRTDLVDAERAELVIIEAYLPESLPESEVDAIIAQAVIDSGATSAREAGKVMGLAMKRLKETGKRFDGGAVNQKVKARLEP